MKITPIHRVLRLRIEERPSDMEVSCEYGNKQSRTKSRVALQQGIVPVSCPARVSGEDLGLQDVGSVHEAINQIY